MSRWIICDNNVFVCLPVTLNAESNHLQIVFWSKYKVKRSVILVSLYHTTVLWSNWSVISSKEHVQWLDISKSNDTRWKQFLRFEKRPPCRRRRLLMLADWYSPSAIVFTALIRSPSIAILLDGQCFSRRPVYRRRMPTQNRALRTANRSIYGCKSALTRSFEDVLWSLNWVKNRLIELADPTFTVSFVDDVGPYSALRQFSNSTIC